MGSRGSQESRTFLYIFCTMSAKIYLFTVRFRGTFDDSWQFKNVVLSNCANLKSALFELKKQFSEEMRFVIDNVYCEEEKL